MKTHKEIKIIWEYLTKYRKKAYLVAAIALIGSVISAVIPYIYGRLVDIAVVESTSIKMIFGILGIWLFLSLISNWTNRFSNREGENLGINASNDLLLKASGHLLNLPVSYHKDKRIGEILQRIGRASDYLHSIIEEAIFYTTPQLLTVVIALGILAWVEWKLSLALFFIIAAYALVTVLKTRPLIKWQRKLNRAYEKGYGDLYDSTLNIQNVKSCTSEDFERKRNTKNFRNVAQTFQKLIKIWVNLDAWQQTIFGLGFVAIFGLSVILLRTKIISPGELVMFIGYTSLTFQPLARLAHSYRMVKKGMAILKRALRVLEVKPEEYQKKGARELKDIKGEVVFKKVEFRYRKERPVLRGLNFRAKLGEVIALVGESGVGKTTLVDLISRYYIPTQGKILIDGYNIQKVNLKSLRENIAVVPQEITLFNDTIKNNIKYGKPNATNQEIKKVAKAANAHEFIQKFPKKYEQIVGERGIKLSTGQKQRVAIARALLRDPKILILDEATSSLDTKTEKLVQQALKRLIKGRTTFVIAHRLSTITEADKILVLEKGKVAESGRHQDLMKRKDGIYRGLYFLQSEGITKYQSFYKRGE